jgi:hypothetical protein
MDTSRAGNESNQLVGQHSGFCTLVRVGPGDERTYQCLATFALPDGQITARGLISFPLAGGLRASAADRLRACRSSRRHAGSGRSVRADGPTRLVLPGDCESGGRGRNATRRSQRPCCAYARRRGGGGLAARMLLSVGSVSGRGLSCLPPKQEPRVSTRGRHGCRRRAGSRARSAPRGAARVSPLTDA